MVSDAGAELTASNIYYEHAGAGPAVTMLHSGVCDSRMWDPQWGPLAESFTVVRLDMRGFGRTPLERGSYTDAADVASVLDALGIQRTHVVGSSFGGRVALEFATYYPERVDRLVLLCPALQEYPQTRSSAIFAAEEDRLIEAGDIAGATELNVRTWLSRDAPAEVRDLVRDGQRHAFEVQLAADASDQPPEQEYVRVDPARIQAPTLVVGGGYDMDRFLEIARHLGDVMPNARLVELPWAWHLPSLERPAEVTQLLVAALT
jgi:pimeloyl-ACP methyl ester carboxylesterase